MAKSRSPWFEALKKEKQHTGLVFRMSHDLGNNKRCSFAKAVVWKIPSLVPNGNGGPGTHLRDFDEVAKFALDEYEFSIRQDGLIW
jgi:hypothetical protein